jgi:hypothetical protein
MKDLAGKKVVDPSSKPARARGPTASVRLESNLVVVGVPSTCLCPHFGRMFVRESVPDPCHLEGAEAPT